MATGYLLIDRPNTRYSQYRRTRRNGAKVTGTTVIHTFESAPDWVGNDTGAENAVNYLRTRTDPGCYHSAVDSDSTIRLVPWQMETWHCRITNNWSIGISIATKAHLWAKAPKKWRDGALRQAANEAARIHDELYRERGIDVPAKWISRKDALKRKPGFIRHGDTDPGRRSDPWPKNAPENKDFLELYKQARRTGRYAKYGTKGGSPKRGVGKTHTVKTKTATTLTSLALALGLSVGTLTDLNPGTSPTRTLPAGTKVTTPVPPTAPKGDHAFFLTDALGSTPNRAFTYGRPTDEVIAGDFTGSGTSLAVRRGATFYIQNSLDGGAADRTVTFGRPGDQVLVGDWNGDGKDTLAVRRGNTFYLSNDFRGGDADIVLTYGRPGDEVLVGDWNGDGKDTLAVRRGNTFHLANNFRGGDAATVLTYGRPGDQVLVGDWNGNGKDTLAVRRGATFHVSNKLTGGDAARSVTFGRATDTPLVGDWDGDGADTFGIRRGATTK